MTDAILFSAKPSMVDVDDARKHLGDHKELCWSVGFPIAKLVSQRCLPAHRADRCVELPG